MEIYALVKSYLVNFFIFLLTLGLVGAGLFLLGFAEDVIYFDPSDLEALLFCGIAGEREKKRRWNLFFCG